MNKFTASFGVYFIRGNSLSKSTKAGVCLRAYSVANCLARKVPERGPDLAKDDLGGIAPLHFKAMTLPDPIPTTRVFASERFMQASKGEPIRSVVVQTPDAVVVAWLVMPGQQIAAHVHPRGQDTWTVLSGEGLYQTSGGGESRSIGPGDVAVAYTGCVHGVRNTGAEPLRFISVVSPAEAGYELLA